MGQSALAPHMKISTVVAILLSCLVGLGRGEPPHVSHLRRSLFSVGPLVRVARRAQRYNNVNEQQCSTVNEQQCNTVQKQECNTVNEQECNTVQEQQCNTVQEQQCNTVNEQQCNTV